MLITLVIFLVFPQDILAKSTTQLPEKDAKILLNEVQKQLPSKALTYFPDSQEQAAVFIVRNAAVVDQLSYWSDYLSKELLLTIPKAVLPLASTEKVKIIIKAIGLAGNLDEAKNILEDWLTENKIRIKVGTLSKKTGLWYILAYYPLDNTSGEVNAVFYSPQTIPLLSVRRGTALCPWTEEKKINPFKLEIQGKVETSGFQFFGRSVLNNYIWEETTKGPIVSFPKNIPEFPKSLEKTSFFQKVKNFFSRLIPFQSAQISQPIKELTQELPKTELLEKEEPNEKENYKETIINGTFLESPGNFKIKYLDTIWRLNKEQENFPKLEHKALDCTASLTLGLEPTLCMAGGPGCDFIEEQTDLNLNNKNFKRDIKQIKNGKEITIAYYFNSSNFEQRPSFGEVGLEWIVVFSNQNNYKQCMSDFEEVLKTLEFTETQQEQEESMKESELFIEEKREEQKAETSEEKVIYEINPLHNGVTIGDFSITLSKIEKENDETYLWFTMRRIKITPKANTPAFMFKAVDDRGNVYEDSTKIRYSGILCNSWENIGASGVGISSVPLGFTWHWLPCKFKAPSIAPLSKVEIYGHIFYPFQRTDKKLLQVIDLNNFKTEEIDLDAELKKAEFISSGHTFKKGENLLITIQELKKNIDNPDGWSLPIEIQNLDYNSHEFKMAVGIQKNDGTITWNMHKAPYAYQGLSVKVPGLSKEQIDFAIPRSEDFLPLSQIRSLLLFAGRSQFYIYKITP